MLKEQAMDQLVMASLNLLTTDSSPQRCWETLNPNSLNAISGSVGVEVGSFFKKERKRKEKTQQ